MADSSYKPEVIPANSAAPLAVTSVSLGLKTGTPSISA